MIDWPPKFEAISFAYSDINVSAFAANFAHCFYLSNRLYFSTDGFLSVSYV